MGVIYLILLQACCVAPASFLGKVLFFVSGLMARPQHPLDGSSQRLGSSYVCFITTLSALKNIIRHVTLMYFIL